MMAASGHGMQRDASATVLIEGRDAPAERPLKAFLSASVTLTLGILGSSVLPVPFAFSRTGGWAWLSGRRSGVSAGSGAPAVFARAAPGRLRRWRLVRKAPAAQQLLLQAAFLLCGQRRTSLLHPPQVCCWACC